MIGKFEPLSVAEDEYRSDRLSSRQEIFIRDYGVNATQLASLQLSVNADKLLTIQSFKKGVLLNKIDFPNLDIDGMIKYLQDVKIFLSEEDMMKKLLGEK